MAVKGKKQARDKWNFLVMRSQGEVTNFSVSPILLAVAFLFALVFVVCSVVVINRYFSLYLEHQELAENRRRAMARQDLLSNQHQYHIALTQDYAELLAELNDQLGSGNEANAAILEDTLEDAPETAALAEEDPLADWASRLPAVTEGIKEHLNVTDFKVEGNRFSFQLINETAGTMARGRLLTLFLVETRNRRQVAPFPDFDPRSSQPNFEPGAGYNIRSSKHISGQLKIPPNSKILAMMVAAQTNDGQMVMKKLVKP